MSVSNDTTATARVILTLEIDGCGGSWGAACTVEQAYRQAKVGAEEMIRHAFPHPNVRVVGEPRVVAILTERPARSPAT